MTNPENAVTETGINLPFVTADQDAPKHLALKLTRATFGQLVDDLLQRTRRPSERDRRRAGRRGR